MVCGGLVGFRFFCLVGFCGNTPFGYMSTSVLDISYFDFSVISYLNRTAITLLSVGPFGIERGFTVRGYEARLNEYQKKPQLPLR